MMPEFDALGKILDEVPATWVPALLRRLVITAVKKKVFKPGPDGLALFIRTTENEAHVAAAKKA